MRLFRSAPKSAAALLVVALVLAPRAAMSEYRLQTGDTLEVSLTGVPDFRARSPIGVEGEISVPLAGQIKVAKLSVAQAREKIAHELSNRLYRRYATDGHEVQHLILGDEVAIAVVEYSPIYVNGDVSKPDAYAFRAGMTVRQAVALAGGYNLMRLPAANPVLQAADVQSEYETLWLTFASEQAHAWRLRTELGEQGVENMAKKAPVPAEVSQRFTTAEADQLKARMADRETEKARLQDAINKANLQIGILAEKKAKDEEGNQADAADLKTARDLFQKGLAPVTRLSEARRATLFSSEQLLQTIIEISNVERQRDNYAHQLEKVDSLSRIDDLQELERTNVSLAQTIARLRADGNKLMQVGLLRSELVRGPDGRIVITVYRRGDGGTQRLVANEDMELVPGDVVDVAMQGENGAEALTPHSNVGAEAAINSTTQK